MAKEILPPALWECVAPTGTGIPESIRFKVGNQEWLDFADLCGWIELGIPGGLGFERVISSTP